MEKAFYSPAVNCLIVDADPGSAQELENLLKEIESVTLWGNIVDVSCARQIVSEIPVMDVVFFGTGKSNPYAFEIADVLQVSFKWKIFIGDDNDAALKAFHAGADSFLKRPLVASIFEAKMQDLIASNIQHQGPITTNNQLWVPVRINNPKNHSAL